MRLRSLLFVPGDRPERFDKAVASGADAVILDLEDSVASARKDEARRAVERYLSCAARRRARLFVRVNSLDSGLIADDAAATRGADAVVLPKAEGSTSVLKLEELLPDTSTMILPIATETPRAIFKLDTYCGSRLCGLTWGAEDLPAAIGAATSREPDGSYTSPYEVVRALTLFAAHAAGAPAIETVFPSIQDVEGLKAYAARGARDGFAGMMAIHPSQVSVINGAFMPTEAEVTKARAIVAAFAARPDAGALNVEGKMVDAPHLKQARLVLSRAEEPCEETL